MSDCLTAGRPGRSTVAVIGRPGQSTNVHRMCKQPSWGGRSNVSVDRHRALLSGKPPVDRAVNRAESTALCFQTRSTERSTGQRAVALWIWHGRPEGQSGPFLCQRADSKWGLFIPHLKWVLKKIFKRKISPIL